VIVDGLLATASIHSYSTLGGVVIVVWQTGKLLYMGIRKKALACANMQKP
jgi:hypothetical protein